MIQGLKLKSVTWDETLWDDRKSQVVTCELVVNGTEPENFTALEKLWNAAMSILDVRLAHYGIALGRSERGDLRGMGSSGRYFFFVYGYPGSEIAANVCAALGVEYKVAEAA